jgi:hypothetical protein
MPTLFPGALSLHLTLSSSRLVMVGVASQTLHLPSLSGSKFSTKSLYLMTECVYVISSHVLTQVSAHVQNYAI